MPTWSKGRLCPDPGAVRVALAEADRTAYQRQPEGIDSFWDDAEEWGGE
jgi:hypothetical protein